MGPRSAREPTASRDLWQPHHVARGRSMPCRTRPTTVLCVSSAEDAVLRQYSSVAAGGMAARLVLEDGTQYAGRLFGAARSVPGEVGEPPAAHVEYCTCSRGYCCAFGNAAQQIAHVCQRQQAVASVFLL